MSTISKAQIRKAIEEITLNTSLCKGDIDALDRLLLSMSGMKYRLPVLLRKYFSCGARVACFNVDPLFFNSLDGMIVLRVDDFPPAALRTIVRPLPKELQDTVFRHFYGTANPE